MKSCDIACGVEWDGSACVRTEAAETLQQSEYCLDVKKHGSYARMCGRVWSESRGSSVNDEGI
eukprot:2777244-Prymnesium_polylepis.1